MILTMQHIKSLADNCNSCGLCVKECSFLQENGTPGEICLAFLSRDSENFNSIFQCNLCGLCQAVCPKKLECPLSFLEIRKALQIRSGKEKKTPSILPEHSTICRYEAIGSSRIFSLYLCPEGAQSIFFPGCTLAATRSSVTRTTYEYLQSIDPNIGIVLDCCTKPSHDLGLNNRFLASFRKMTCRLAEKNIKKVVTACPSCHAAFSKYAPELEITTVYEIIALNPPLLNLKHTATISIHDTCASRHNKNILDSVRTLVKNTGARLEEMNHSRSRAICCGEGASASFIAPHLQKTWTDLRKKEANGHRIVTYCAGCSSSLSKSIPTTHLLDLLFNSEKALQCQEKVVRPPLTYISRLLLKKKLQKSARTAQKSAK
jgi:Fe-S oxidoreductase